MNRLRRCEHGSAAKTKIMSSGLRDKSAFRQLRDKNRADAGHAEGRSGRGRSDVSRIDDARIALNPTSPPSTMMPAVSAIAIVTLMPTRPSRRWRRREMLRDIIASVATGTPFLSIRYPKMKAKRRPPGKRLRARRRQNRARRQQRGEPLRQEEMRHEAKPSANQRNVVIAVRPS